MPQWDDRAQSIQIGAVLIFAVLVLLLALYQATVVPQQNQRAEFDHSQAVRGDLLDLRNAVVSMAGDSAPRSVSVRLGTRYSPRLLGVNPAPPSGDLRTVGTADGGVALGVDNAEALDPETDDFWNGTQRNFSTGGIVYRPDYNEYARPPTTAYENAVLYDRFEPEGRNLARSGQALIDGDRITLVALNGSLQRASSNAASVDVRPVSASPTAVSVTNENAGSNVTLRLPTRLSERRWEELLADQRVGEGGNVTAGDDGVYTEPLPGVPGYETLVVELVAGTYELRMAKAGVGTRVTGTSAAYLTVVSGDGSTVPEGGRQQVVVEVRDRYNNPVSGQRVRATASWTGRATAVERTAGDGRASFTVTAPEDGGPTEGRVNISIGGTAPSASFDATTPENASANVTVVDTTVSGTGGGDGAGPAVADLAATPDPVAQGETVTLSATVDDVERGGLDVIAAEWFRAGPGETLSGQDPGNGTANPLAAVDGQWDQATESVGDSVAADWAPGDHTIAVRGKDASGNWGRIGTTNVTVARPLVTAVEPDPEQLGDAEGEFVRLEVPDGVDTTGWTLADGDGNAEALSDLDGTVYVARNATAFADQWDGVSAGEVESFDFVLDDGGDAVELRGGSGAVIDRFAYEGQTFDDGTSFDFASSEYGGQVAARDRTDGSYVDTDTAGDWAERAECSLLGGGDGCSAAGGFDVTGATALLPETGGQRQSFTFAPGTPIGSGTTVEIVLDDPQGQSPLRVDYGASAGVPSGSPLTVTDSGADGDSAYVNVTADSEIAAGETVRVWTDGVDAGSAAEYDVEFVRHDTGASAASSFAVNYTAGTAAVSAFEATDLRPGTAGQQQNFTFRLDADLAAGERVVVGLSGPEGDGVSYQALDAVNVSTGSTDFVRGAGRARVSLTAPAGGLSAGTGVEVAVVADTGGMNNAPYEVGISRGDADTTSTTFDRRRQPTPNRAYEDRDGDGAYRPWHGDFPVDLSGRRWTTPPGPAA